MRRVAIGLRSFGTIIGGGVSGCNSEVQESTDHSTGALTGSAARARAVAPLLHWRDAMRGVALALVASFACEGCTYTYDYVRAPQPEVERAGHELLTQSRASVRTDRGNRLTVDDETNVLHKDPSAHVSEFTLRSEADGCWGTKSAPCTLTSGGDYSIRVKRTIPDKDAWLAGTVITLGLGVVATYVTAQVTCFSSWCDDVGKGAFIASDVVMRGMNN